MRSLRCFAFANWGFLGFFGSSCALGFLLMEDEYSLSRVGPTDLPSPPLVVFGALVGLASGLLGLRRPAPLRTGAPRPRARLLVLGPVAATGTLLALFGWAHDFILEERLAGQAVGFITQGHAGPRTVLVTYRGKRAVSSQTLSDSSWSAYTYEAEEGTGEGRLDLFREVGTPVYVAYDSDRPRRHIAFLHERAGPLVRDLLVASGLASVTACMVAAWMGSRARWVWTLTSLATVSSSHLAAGAIGWKWAEHRIVAKSAMSAERESTQGAEETVQIRLTITADGAVTISGPARRRLPIGSLGAGSTAQATTISVILEAVRGFAVEEEAPGSRAPRIDLVLIAPGESPWGWTEEVLRVFLSSSDRTRTVRFRTAEVEGVWGSLDPSAQADSSDEDPRESESSLLRVAVHRMKADSPGSGFARIRIGAEALDLPRTDRATDATTPPIATETRDAVSDRITQLVKKRKSTDPRIRALLCTPPPGGPRLGFEEMLWLVRTLRGAGIEAIELERAAGNLPTEQLLPEAQPEAPQSGR
ncbi:MAG TPA: hypothetical protein VI893_03750 [Thermoplasmata archaeon]|nr:hypothetical protein [Thermoplasmata archaeon]